MSLVATPGARTEEEGEEEEEVGFPFGGIAEELVVSFLLV